MPDFFRAKIVAKRQVTLPQLMLDRLRLREGDELEFTVNDGRIAAVRTFRPVPMDYFPQEVLEMIDRRNREIASGEDGGYWEPAHEAKVEKMGVFPEYFVEPNFEGVKFGIKNAKNSARTAKGLVSINENEKMTK